MIAAMASSPARLRLVIFDLDGVVYRGADPIPGAAELIARLHDLGLAIRFATNNSMRTRAAYVELLAGMGIPAVDEEIVTSTSATVDHLALHAPGGRRLLAVGAPAMRSELLSGGHDVTLAADAVPVGYEGGPLAAGYDAVVAGLDPAFDYRRLAAAVSAVRGGALLIATNADARYPTASGFLPGAGSMVAAIAAGSGARPLVIGKPAPAMFLTSLERAGVRPDEALVVGDNPDADVVAAHRAGIRAVLVLTGVVDASAARRLRGRRRPDAIARGPSEVGTLVADWLS